MQWVDDLYEAVVGGRQDRALDLIYQNFDN